MKATKQLTFGDARVSHFYCGIAPFNRCLRKNVDVCECVFYDVLTDNSDDGEMLQQWRDDTAKPQNYVLHTRFPTGRIAVLIK